MKKVLKWIGIVLGGLVGLLLIAVLFIFIKSSAGLNKTYDVGPTAIAIPEDADAVARGKHIFETRGCQDCHAADLSGGVMIDDPAIAVIYAPNLTSGEGGVGDELTDEDWVAAIRYGVDQDRRSLFIMPSMAYTYLNDQDLGDLIAYLKALDPVDKPFPERQIGPMGRMGLALGQFPFAADLVDPNADRSLVEAGPTSDYGNYLVDSSGCHDCHGANLSGGEFPGPQGPSPIPAANLTPAGNLPSWTLEDFTTTIRSGVRPDGSTLDPAMPWSIYSRFTDDELTAIYLYLQTIPAAETPLPEDTSQ